MDEKIKALKKHLSSIEEIISSLEEKNANSDTGFEIDINQIDKMAKQAPYMGHFISEYDEEVIKKYIIFLASIVREADDIEKRTKQYYFISRLLHGTSIEMSISEWITKSELVELSDIEFIKEAINDDCTLMAFDILLMISMDGAIDERQMNYFCEVLAYFSLDKKIVDALVKTCTFILKGEEAELFQYASMIPISKLSCYLKNPINEEVVSSVEGLRKSKNQDVVVAGVVFKNAELDIDKFNKISIDFKNCKFENISSIRARKTKVSFNNCSFDRCCKQGEFEDNIFFGLPKTKTIFDNALIAIKTADFVECKFEKCGQEYVNPISIFIGLKQGKISRCTFKECFARVNAVSRKRYSYSSSFYCYEHAALVYTNKVVMDNCKFVSCSCYGNGIKTFLGGDRGRLGAEYEYLNIIYCNGGSIENCEFNNCTCDGKSRDGIKRFNYIINRIGAMEKDNKFIKCNVSNEGSEKWENVN